MIYWPPQIDNVCRLIWLKLNEGETVKETTDKNDAASEVRGYVSLDIPFERWRIFGFLDNTGFRTNPPRFGARHIHGFHDDIQRAFYSTYFSEY